MNKDFIEIIKIAAAMIAFFLAVFGIGLIGSACGS